MSEYDDIDGLTGGKAIDPSQIPNKTLNRRIKPANKQKFQGGNSFSTISADPHNPEVKLIIEYLENGNVEGAKSIADASPAPEFLNDFITEYVKNGGQDDKNWMYARRIHAGAKGKNSPVTVELSYDADGDLNVVSVPKNMIYAVDMRSWKNSNLLPKPSGSSTLSTPPNPAESGDGPELAPPPANEVSNPSNPIADKAPPVDYDNPLANLIGGTMVAGLKQLGLLDGVKVADIDMTDFKVISGRDSTPFKIIGSNKEALSVSGVIPLSSFGPQDQKGNFTSFSPENMGDVLYQSIIHSVEELDSESSVSEMVEQLRTIRMHMDALSRVFGFDDPKQLEAFFCAWLMKDSTCRLSGIPGTGKTTVINSAATLLANSYGFNVAPRFVAKKNAPMGTPHDYYIFPTGQAYAVDYSDKNQELTRREWEDWRFSTWGDKNNKSGAYLYDFKFLQRKSDTGYAKHPMTPEQFANLLLASPTRDENGMLSNKIMSSPIKYADLVTLFGEHGVKVPNVVSQMNGNAQILGSPLFTDSGGNEGFVFRDFLMEHFYDERLGSSADNSGAKFGLISAEMLHECGIAKIDYDKRAEEILYGVEIRQITEKNELTQKTVASYSFDPTPRPVVTQPVKFFNEANRSGSGVEDAILGLIAEKTVEYRGQTFTSPSFVAWMDTNPHQKGNDLAFVDRIDMELLFGTLSLGGRFNTLLSRYSTGAKGSTPEIQLVKRMLPNKTDDKFISPMRFADLSSVWGNIGDLPFNSSGAGEEEEGALLDISLLSVLFTQRWMIQGLETDVYGKGKHTFKDNDNPFSSPLADISTTTNSQFESIHSDWWKLFGNEASATGTQAPMLITRMLGFRFSNSLIKMTRAMAFLRGKDHVTRQEVLDALPYCLGHRLGPAREGEDPKGRDIGIMREGMTVANEQDFVREIILNGYVLRNTKSIMAAADNRSLMDLWDSFIRNCRSYLESTDAYWKYETDVLLAIKPSIRNQSSSITPVHWAIATMIVENQKRKPSYKDKLSRYQERLQRPASKGGTKKTDVKIQKEQLMADVSISQYMKIRGEISADMKLFSDDKTELLSLADSKIDAISGNVLKATKTNCNFMAVAPKPKEAIGPYKLKGGKFATYEGFSKGISQGISNPNQFKWRCYNDGMGAWGYIVSNGQNLKPIAKLGQGATGQDYFDVAGADYDANQALGFLHQFTVPKEQEVITDNTFAAKMESVLEALDVYSQNGVLIGQKGSSYGVKAPLASLKEYQEQALTLLNQWISRPKGSKPAINDGLLQSGFNACFRANHTLDSVEGSMEVQLNENTTTTIEGNDELRLWLSMRCISGNNATAGTKATVGFFIGISSATMQPSRKENGDMILDADKNPTGWEILPFDADESYRPSFYTGNKADEMMYQDVGNLTMKDYRIYVKLALDAINNHK